MTFLQALPDPEMEFGGEHNWEDFRVSKLLYITNKFTRMYSQSSFQAY